MKLFLGIVRAAFLGEKYQYGSKTFNLSPCLAQPYDFSRKKLKSSNEYERLLSTLDKKFRDAAKSDLYRKNTGWLYRGEQGRKIRAIKINGAHYILPILKPERTVAIDTSTINNNSMVVGFHCIPDFESAYVYLEKHLELPKTHNHAEFHWSKLNPEKREKVLTNFPTLLQISCDALLVINTDTLISPVRKHETILSNLIDGCFSGYETTEGSLRLSIKNHLYELTNNTRIHCDADFSPLKPLEVTATYVKRLGQGLQPDPIPLFADLPSHKSRPIQIADILIGAIRTKIQRNDISPLKILKFDKRKIKSQKSKTASAWYWAVGD